VKREFFLNGNKIYSENTFFREITITISPDFKWKYGYNYAILREILEGDYGLLDCNEPCIIRWQRFKISASKMEEVLLFKLVSVFDELANVELILE
jgi:hypothetical protein|tara:strand:- start:261 stop:548 length:288 start_codon:yes stop_codon:yes gene_type:complete